MYKYLIFLFVFLYKVCPAQVNSIIIKGSVSDSAGAAVNNSYIKISGSRSGLILKYFNTGASSFFLAEVNPGFDDSLVITVSHPTFISYTERKAIRKDETTIECKIHLKPKYNDLDSVIIKSMPVWKRGDTTFFSVNQFKEGEEKKLKDIIVKMPGFEFTDEGQLLYRKKPIERILVDGEEIFASNAELLLNNFPVHVLNTIQAIENQSSQKLLKGLSVDGKVFLNLGLNKSRLQAAFGDGEMGVGTAGQYIVTPVIFSLYGKLKIGYIGNLNSIGNGITWKQENELKNISEKVSQNWMINNHPLQLINNFENRWYITNRQWDNRVQLNVPILNKLISQTQISWIKDRQKQRSIYASVLFSDSMQFNRTDENFIQFRPHLINLKQSIKWNPDSTKQVNFEFSFFGDHSFGSQVTRFLQKMGEDELYAETGNSWKSFSFSSEYIHRVSHGKAREWFFAANKQDMKQHGLGRSQHFNEVFSSADSLLQTLHLYMNNETLNLQGGLKETIKSKNGVQQRGFEIQRWVVKPENDIFLQDENQGSGKVYPFEQIKDVQFLKNSFRTFYNSPLKFLFKNPFQVNINLGVDQTEINEGKVRAHFATPTALVGLSQRHALFGLIKGVFNGSIHQGQAELFRMNQSNYAKGLYSYRRSANILEPLRKFQFDYSIGWDGTKNLTSTYLGFYYTRNFSGFVPVIDFNRFVQFSNDSIVTVPFSTYRISASHSQPSLFFNAMINFDAAYGYYNSLLSINREIKENAYSFWYMNFSMKKNWNRKFFIQLQSRLTIYDLHFPPSFRQISNSKVVNVVSRFSGKAIVKKRMNILANFSLFNNNLLTTNKASFLFGDIEWNYQLKNFPVSFSLRADNIFNATDFYSYRNTPVSQSFYKVPLVGRSIIGSVRVSF